MRLPGALLAKLEALRRLAAGTSSPHERDNASRAADALAQRIGAPSDSALAPAPQPFKPGHPGACRLPWCEHCDAIAAWRRKKLR